MTPAAELAEWLRRRPPRAGRTRVLAVEGRSGAGKSTIAGEIAEALAVAVISMDDLYFGWDGLLAGVEALRRDVLEPLARGAPAGYRRYDWQRETYADWHDVPAADALVVEGVGSGARAVTPYLSGLLWVEAPAEVRRRRALDRDGEVYAPHWDRWAAHEDDFYAHDPVHRRADATILHLPGGFVADIP